MASETDQIQDIQALRRSLKKAIADVKTRDADRNDVVIEMKEAEGARLQLLADELRPLMQEIDESDDRFEFALTRGDKPRLWIDMTSFISMGHDKRSYRFLKDTRMGRIVLAESGDMHKVADIVSEYVAEKVVERERMIEGEWLAQKNAQAYRPDSEDDSDENEADTTMQDTGGAESSENAAALVQDTVSQEVDEKTKGGGLGRFFWFLFGATCALGALVGAAFFMARDAL